MANAKDNETKIYNFPPTVDSLFESLDESRKIKGNITINKDKLARLYNGIAAINEYGKSRQREVRAMIDDPDEPFETHTIMVDFETSEFNRNEVQLLSRIIEPFDYADFSCDDNGNLSVLLHLEDVYTKKKP